MTSDQLRMARALLRLNQSELAVFANVTANTIRSIENGNRGRPSVVKKLRVAFIERGVLFIDAFEPYHGAGVAMRWGVEAPAGADD